VKALVDTFNQEKALQGAFSVIVKSSFKALVTIDMVRQIVLRSRYHIIVMMSGPTLECSSVV
jgi:hypothetical protein